MTTYDIYNLTLAADKPFVDSIVNAVYVQLEQNINNGINKFNFSLINYLYGLSLDQHNRIIDRVLCLLRNSGISVRISVTPLTPQDMSDFNPFYTPFFNNLNNRLNLLSISNFTRLSSEYLKTYY